MTQPPKVVEFPDAPPSEAAIADMLKSGMRIALEGVCNMQAKAGMHGMRIEFQLGIDMYGRHTIHSMNVLKVL